MNSWGETIAAGMALVFIALVWILFLDVGCTQRWRNSGHQSQWGVMTGCLVEVDGKWLPEDAVRRFEN